MISADRARVLLVLGDDELEMYESALARFGFEVASASNPGEAFYLAVELRPAALVTDLYFTGGVTGIDLLRALRALRAEDDTRQIPAICVASLDHGPEREEAETAGFDLLRPKPQPAEELAGDLRRLIASKPQSLIG
jgi:CheY-like chemotaxis protein